MTPPPTRLEEIAAREQKATQRSRRNMHGVNIPEALWEQMQTWLGKQVVRPNAQAFLEAAILEFLSHHP
jgi:hypothetical protein